MQNGSSKLIVFITGTFIGNNCWGDWKIYFEQKGYKSIAPAWPFKDASPEELRNRSAEDGISLNRLHVLTDYFEAIINALPSKPILIGHSLGGLIVQLLLQKGFARAGVAIHSFPPVGINTFNFAFFKTVWQSMAFFSPERKSYMISYKKWKQAVANGMTDQEQKEFYYKYATPESKLLIRDAFTCKAGIHFKKHHAPLLLTSGSHDRVVPEKLVYNLYRDYKVSGSIVDFKNFNDHNHLVFDCPTMKKEADFILYWLEGLSVYH